MTAPAVTKGADADGAMPANPLRRTPSMPDQTARGSDQAEIRHLLQAHAAAHEAKDADALIAGYAPDALLSDLAPPLQFRGVDRPGLEAWLKTWDGPIGLSLHDLDVSIGGDIAFATSLNRMTGDKTDGTHVDLWFRATVCLRKVEDRWLVVHEHTSVPFHMDGSLRAAVDLEP